MTEIVMMDSKRLFYSTGIWRFDST